MSTLLSGINPLSYRGIEALSPLQLLQFDRRPTPNDWENYVLGTLWLVRKTQEIWFLSSLVGNTAVWVLLFPGGSGTDRFITDTGTATQVAGVLNVFGANGIVTTGAGNTITVNVDSTFAITYICDIGSATPNVGLLAIVGGTVVTTTGSGDTITIDLDNSTNGYTLIGGGIAAQYAPITSLNGTIAVTSPAPNTINLEAVGTGLVEFYDADVGTASPDGLGALVVAGGSNINTTTVADLSNNLFVNLDNSVSISGSLAANGTVTSGNTLTVTTGGITAAGQIQFTDLNDGVMQTNAGGVVSSTNGANGQVLIGGGAAPAWANITSSGGSIGITNGPNTINLSATGGVLPSQRASFLAVLSSDFTIGTAGATAAQAFGTNQNPGQVWSVIFDNTASITDLGGISFTAPLTGKYFLEVYTTVDTTNISASYYKATLEMRTGAIIVYRGVYDINNNNPNSSKQCWGIGTLANLTAGQQVLYYWRNQTASSGTQNYTFKGGSSTVLTWISGYLAA